MKKEDCCKTCNSSLPEGGKYIAVPIDTFQEWIEPTGIFDPGPLIARMDYYCLECWDIEQAKSVSIQEDT